MNTKKKPTVRFLELSRSSEVIALETRINSAVEKAGLTSGPIRLFQHDDGTYGFSAQVSASPGRKQDLDALYDLVMSILPTKKRGRRRSPIRKVQAKFMIPRDLHEQIKKRAEEEALSASELVERCLRKAV